MKYTFGLVLTLYIGAFFNHYTFFIIADILFPDYYFISYYEIGDILRFLIVYLVLSTLLKLSKSWFQLIENQRLITNLQKENLDSELRVLKSQINPHFLFNSLNNLYGLALDEDKKTPEVILQLSKSMRYMLYESSEDFVELEKEITFLKNYLDLQRLRINDQTAIHFEITGTAKGKKIAPLLFIPFVENAVKHGIKGDIENAFINIQLNIEEDKGDEDRLSFIVENNKGSVDEIETDTYKGIGLQNVKRRLDLLYPKKHELKIMEKGNTFTISLKINSL